MALYGFLHSKEDLDLARAECVNLFDADEVTFLGPLTLLETDETGLFPRLAFTRRVFLILGRSSEAEELSGLVPIGERTLRLDHQSLDGTDGLSTTQLRKLLLRAWGSPKVFLTDPDIHLVIFSSKDGYVLSELVHDNHEDFASRKNHNLPAPHPTSSHPKLLRAMINLSGARREVLDPFCGSGGLLIEAALMGLKVTGVDIDQKMLLRARKNLAHLGLEVDLQLGDALEWDKKVERIVTDLPYGRNSRSDELGRLYSSFLRLASRLAHRMVVCFPSTVDHKRLVTEAGLRMMFYSEWRLHKSLTKHIYLLGSDVA